MDAKILTAIETYVKKHGFWKLAKKDVFAKGQVPNMQIVDVMGDVPWCGISSGTTRIEAEGSGITEILDIKQNVMRIYDELSAGAQQPPASAEPPTDETVIATATKELTDLGKIQEVDGKDVIAAVKKLTENKAQAKRCIIEVEKRLEPVPPEMTSDIEAEAKPKLPFACYGCGTGITAAQRNTSFQTHGKAYCPACIEKLNAAPPAKVSEAKIPETQGANSGSPPDGATSCHHGADNRNPKTESFEAPAESMGKKRDDTSCHGVAIASAGNLPDANDIYAETTKLSTPDTSSHRGFSRATSNLPAPKPPKERPGKQNLPAKREEQLPAKTDQQLDDEIERAKAERFLKGQGGSYNVAGKNVPDSAMVQKVANDAGIDTEILIAEQTKEYAHVVVRGHLNGHYIDAVVHHDYETEFMLKTMEIIDKNPQILDHYEGTNPIMKEGTKIRQGDVLVDAKYYLVHALLSFRKFSLRDAATKAMHIAEKKLLNKDWRDKEEIESEQAECKLVESNKKR